MNDVIFIGNRLDVETCRDAGIPSYSPPFGLLAERVVAERGRCRVLAMTEATFSALPTHLARQLREGIWPRLVIVPEMRTAEDRLRLRELVDHGLTRVSTAVA